MISRRGESTSVRVCTTNSHTTSAVPPAYDVVEARLKTLLRPLHFSEADSGMTKNECVLGTKSLNKGLPNSADDKHCVLSCFTHCQVKKKPGSLGGIRTRDSRFPERTSRPLDHRGSRGHEVNSNLCSGGIAARMVNFASRIKINSDWVFSSRQRAKYLVSSTYHSLSWASPL